MKVFSFLPITTLVVLLNVPIVANAQVLIPDTLMRSWLNNYIPGIVDGSGIMDTLHPGIANLDTAHMYIGGYQIPNIDLTGIQYLDSLSYFSADLSLFPYGYNLICPGFPANLSTLRLSEIQGTLTLPRLPAKMEMLDLSNWGGGVGSIMIAGMPDTVETMIVDGNFEVAWQGTGYIGQLIWTTGYQQVSAAIPPIQAGRLFFSLNLGGEFQMDLSAVECVDVFYNESSNGSSVIWPQDMETLYVHFIVSGSLGSLPASLRSLTITSNNVCIPFLPDGLIELYIENTTECIPNWPASLTNCSCPWSSPAQANYCSILNSDCPGAYSGISGRVFVDTDADGQYDVGEPGLPQVRINLQPGGHTVGSNDEGIWEAIVQPGSYAITASSNYPYATSISPAQHNADLPNLGDIDLGNDFAATLLPDIEDLRVHIFSEPVRPGFDNRVFLACENYGTVPLGVDLTLVYHPDQTWVVSSAVPDVQSANTVTWNLGLLGVGETRHITVDLNTPSFMVLGTPLSHALSAEPIATDQTPADNTTLFTDVVVGSCDPNDKTASPSIMSPAQVQTGETPIEYTIRFQNTGTYLAERVVILDTLSEDLQWESMRFIASSHPNHWYVTDGVLHVIHNDIMLPDSTSDEAGSHGFIKFSMLPATDLQDGATINNIAHIVFDFNEPIITPPAIFTVDIEASVLAHATEQMRVYPNPAADLLRIELPSGNFQGMSYVVRDVLGQEVLRGRLNGSKQVTISGIEDGSYTIEMIGAETRRVARFVKQ